MIPPSINKYIDVHGLGREGSDELSGLLNGFINRENASSSYDMKLIPSGTTCNELLSIDNIVSWKNINGDTITYKCLIQEFLITLDYNTSVKRNKRVTWEDVNAASCWFNILVILHGSL